MFMIAFVNAFGPLAIAPQVPMYMAEWPGKTVADILQFVRRTLARVLSQFNHVCADRSVYPCSWVLKLHLGADVDNIREAVGLDLGGIGFFGGVYLAGKCTFVQLNDWSFYFARNWSG
jgi:hypothetical protein